MVVKKEGAWGYWGVDNLPYVLNGPIYLFLLGILLMGLEVNILHENNMLQDLLQICKFYWRHNYVR